MPARRVDAVHPASVDDVRVGHLEAGQVRGRRQGPPALLPAQGGASPVPGKRSVCSVLRFLPAAMQTGLVGSDSSKFAKFEL